MTQAYNWPSKAFTYPDILAPIRAGGGTLNAGGATSIALDATTVSPIGGSSIKVNIAENDAAQVEIILDSAGELGTHVGLIIKATTVAPLINKFILRARDSSSTGYNWSPFELQTFYGLEDEEWKICWMRRDNFKNTSGSPATWATGDDDEVFPLDRFYIQTTATHLAIEYWIGGVISSVPEKAKIVLRFDDGYEGNYDYAFPRMQARDYKGVLAVVSDNIDEAGFLTLLQAQEMHDAGWDMVNHSQTHTLNGDTATPAAYLAEIEACRRYCQTNGLLRGSGFLLPPGNLCDLSTDQGGDDMEPYFTMMGGDTSRAIYGDTGPNGVITNQKSSTEIPADMGNIPFYQLNLTSKTDYSAAAQGFVQETVNQKNTAVLYMHDIVADPTATIHISEGFFDDMLADLAAHEAAGDLEVITWSDWYNDIAASVPLADETSTGGYRSRYNYQT